MKKMDSLHTGSNELVYIQTDKVSVTIKKDVVHSSTQGVVYENSDSTIKVFCSDYYDLSLNGYAETGIVTVNNDIHSGVYVIRPLFFEQQQYELVIEQEQGYKVSFWHDNLNVRNKVTPTGRLREMLSGVINFGNEIGLSDLVIKIDNVNYMRLTIEVFPTKINYKEDYRSIIEDVTNEVYNVVFDFLKKTYLGYQQSDRVNNSLVEFLAIIRKIYQDFTKAIDMILAQPHHVLETTHEVMQGQKIKRIDRNTIGG